MLKHLNGFKLELCIHVLKKIREQVIYPKVGICGNFKHAVVACVKLESYELDQLRFTLHKLMEHWPKFSGCSVYPIKVPKADIGKFRNYYSYAGSRNLLWDKRTEYGRLRYELLDFLIEKFEAELKIIT